MTASIVPDTAPTRPTDDLLRTLGIPPAHLGYAHFSAWLRSIEPHSQICVIIDDTPAGASGWNRAINSVYLLLQHRAPNGVIHYCRSLAGMAPPRTEPYFRVLREAEQLRNAMADYLSEQKVLIEIVEAAYALPENMRLVYAPLPAVQDPDTRIWRVIEL